MSFSLQYQFSNSLKSKEAVSGVLYVAYVISNLAFRQIVRLLFIFPITQHLKEPKITRNTGSLKIYSNDSDQTLIKMSPINIPT